MARIAPTEPPADPDPADTDPDVDPDPGEEWNEPTLLGLLPGDEDG